MELTKTAPPCGKLIPNPKSIFRDQFREVLWFKNFSQRTEDAYRLGCKMFAVSAP